MKRVLIISPSFPPVNAADMQRVRMSLPYFRSLGWEPVVIAVNQQDAEAYSSDPILSDTIPGDIEVHWVKAFRTKYTRKLGLGSLSLRSLLFIRRKGRQLLARQHFDLVYFSTTAFHLMALGPQWKKKYGVPFIVDIQDPWRNDFYLDKPKAERPPKFRVAYTLDKYLEARTIPVADGIISVSRGYCDTFMQRYPGMSPAKFKVIPFAGSSIDFTIMEKKVKACPAVPLAPDPAAPAAPFTPAAPLAPATINMVYVGRGGHDMALAIRILFGALKKGMIASPEIFGGLRLWFVGTSYATAGTGSKTIEPVAAELGLGGRVTEIPDRIPYFETLFLLRKADILFMPGSTDIHYTASKLYPYILAEKPLLAIFYKGSSVVSILEAVGGASLLKFDAGDAPALHEEACRRQLEDMIRRLPYRPAYDWDAFEPYTAEAMSKSQTDFFEQVLDSYSKP
jgi:hypothetical protein